MLSTLEPESAYSAFNLNLVSELAPLHLGLSKYTAAFVREEVDLDAMVTRCKLTDPGLKAPPGFNF